MNAQNKEILDTKTNQIDFDDLKSLTMSLPSVESFENMKKYLKEAVEEMQADNKQFHEDFKK